jgi:hypothetical protein
VGLVGFGITGVHDFFGTARGSLLGFMVNPFHDGVYMFVRASGLLLARTLAGVRAYGRLLATVFGAGFVYGLFAVGQVWDPLGLNWADNVAHLLLALAGAVLAVAPEPSGLGGTPARA